MTEGKEALVEIEDEIAEDHARGIPVRTSERGKQHCVLRAVAFPRCRDA